MTEKKYIHRTSLAWPILLIGVGILFLLNNINVIDIDLLQMLSRIWPLILVAVGIDILFGRRTGIWQGLTVLIIASIFAAGAWFFQSSGQFISGKMVKEEISQTLNDADRAKIDIDFGVGELRINPLHNAEELLLKGELVLAENEALDQDFRMVGDTAYIQLSSHGPEFSTSWVFNDGGYDRIWDFELSDAIPLDLDVNTGVGQSVIDLRGLIISNLDVDTGVGELIVYLPESGDFTANISAGIGQLTVKVPAGLAIRVHLDTGLGNHRVDGDFNQQDGVYFTDGYYSSEEQVDLYVDGGIGEIVVVILD